MMSPKDIFKTMVLPALVVGTLGVVAVAYILRPKKTQLVEAAKATGRGAVRAAPYVAVGARKAVMKA